MSGSIAVVVTYAVGVDHGAIGVESSAVPFFNEMLESYERVSIAALVNPTAPVKGLTYLRHARLELDRVALVAQRATTLRRVFDYLPAVARILRAVLRGRHFYIFAPGHVSIMYMLACVLLQRRYAVYLRGDWDTTTPYPLRRLKRLLLGRADFVLVTGEKFLREVSPFQSVCSKVVPMMSFSAGSEGFERTFTLGARIRLLFVGQVIPEKGVFELIAALKKVRATCPRVELAIIGDGDGMPALKAAIADNGLQAAVHSPGHLTDAEQLRTLYRESDVFVLPTYFPEGFPRVLYEAMLYSLPIITTDVGGISAMMTSGENCLIVRKRDVDDLARAILAMVEDPELRARTGRTGYRQVKSMLDEVDAEKSSHAKQFMALARRSGWPGGVPAIPDRPSLAASTHDAR